MGYSFPESIRNASVAPGCIEIWWLGQAGFACKTEAGRILYVDPYLTDSVERRVGFRRLMPSVAEPEEVEADALLITHHHEDHLDAEALPVVAGRTKARFLAPPQSAKVLIDLGIEERRISIARPGSPVDLGFCRVHPVCADHGEYAPDAVGFVVDFDCMKAYFTGDTAYRPDMMGEALALKPDLVVPAINGAYGNMDARDAALLVRDAKAATTIPCHFWTFIEHGGDPAAFARECAELSPSSKVVWITQGRSWLYRN